MQKLDDSLKVHVDSCETAYDLELIRLILAVKGPAFLCDDIARDESDEYTAAALKWALLGYVDERAFANTRILDVGCGTGVSTVTLCRMFPSSSVVGVDIQADALSVGRARAAFYGLKNAEFALSHAGTGLPEGIGQFDHIVLCAVYEHLLPKERMRLLPALWAALKPGGVLFLRETPHRYFPIETHTTGLPLINYLPDPWALWATHRFSKRWDRSTGWEELQRAGIRGATLAEIKGILKRCPGPARFLKPTRLGVRDRIDLWYLTAEKTHHRKVKTAIYVTSKGLKRLFGIEFAPYLELAIRKQPAA